MMCSAVILTGKNIGELCSKDIDYAISTTYCHVHQNSITKHGYGHYSIQRMKALSVRFENIQLEYFRKGQITYKQYVSELENNVREFELAVVEIGDTNHAIHMNQHAKARNERKKERKAARDAMQAAVDAEERRVAARDAQNNRIYAAMREAEVRQFEEMQHARNGGLIVEAELHRERIRAQNELLDMYRLPLPPPPNLNEDLRAFAADYQNIHTTIAVKQTTELCALIRSKVVVPLEYQWNTATTSKTPARIIELCGLSPQAAFQMMSKYCSDETIYEMESGIYGKTLDAVLEYIIGSEDKTALLKTLKQELEDNVGMCAQGNLTRLCNILAGYIEAPARKETPQELLGREMPRIRAMRSGKMQAALELLDKSGLPKNEWDDWLSALD